LRNFKLTVEYDGTDFHGWQVQPGLRTVQGELQKALERQLGEPVKLSVAGRTDAGVHASGQVASFRSATVLPLKAIEAGTNSFLPEDVRIMLVEEVGGEFDARRSALARLYRYTIVRRRSPLALRYAYEVEETLDTRAMSAAAALLQGEHDFAAFALKHDDRDYTVCRVETARWREYPDRLVFEIKADHFLRGMVRAIVGTLLQVGKGRLAKDEINSIILNRDRSLLGPTAPAKGLCLVKVYYPGDQISR